MRPPDGWCTTTAHPQISWRLRRPGCAASRVETTAIDICAMERVQEKIIQFAMGSEQQQLHSVLKLFKQRKYGKAYLEALRLERPCALEYLNAAAPEVKQALAVTYHATVLLAACAAAKNGRPGRALQLCDYLHLEVAPPCPHPGGKLLPAALAASVLSASPQRAQATPDPQPGSSRYRIPASMPPDAPRVQRPIRRLDATPGFQAFYRDHVLASEPCILRHAMESWPCCDPERGWSDVRSVARGSRGGRIVRIELADTPGAPIGEDVSVRFVSLAAFVHGCMVAPEHRKRVQERAGDDAEPSSSGDDDAAWPPVPFTFGKRAWWGLQPADTARIGFLAQYQLLEQLPELEEEVGEVPHANELGKGYRIRRNIWIGAAGATTALHFDPKDNWLCQIAGFKYVRLYAAAATPLIPAETAERRRMETDMLRSSGNFSLADVESPRLAQDHPRLAAAPYQETILGPGEMLFIPWGCCERRMHVPSVATITNQACTALISLCLSLRASRISPVCRALLPQPHPFNQSQRVVVPRRRRHAEGSTFWPDAGGRRHAETYGRWKPL